MDPEISFNFSKENLSKIKELLYKIKPEAEVLTEPKSTHLFEVLAMVINEGLHFAQIVQDSQGKAKYLKELEKRANLIQRIVAIIQSR